MKTAQRRRDSARIVDGDLSTSSVAGGDHSALIAGMIEISTRSCGGVGRPSDNRDSVVDRRGRHGLMWLGCDVSWGAWLEQIVQFADVVEHDFDLFLEALLTRRGSQDVRGPVEAAIAKLVPVGILACWILGGAVLILAISRGMASPVSPITDELKAIPEVQTVREKGYEIWFYRSPPNTRYQHWVLEARKFGRDHRHRNKGLATAMLLCATRLTQCRALTTSGRTNQGAKFFEKNRLRLRRNGVELHDGGHDALVVLPFSNRTAHGQAARG